MKSLFGDLKESIRSPEFWGYSTWLSIMTDYRRMRLGLGWALLPPLVYIFGLGFMYSHLMSHRAGAENYYIHLGLGWALWRMTTNVINGSADIYSKHKSFIMDGRTRFTDFVLRAVSRALFNFVFAFGVVLVVILFEPAVHWLNMLTMLVTIPVYVINLVWLAIVVSMLGARYPDVGEFIKTLLMFGFFLTPILWSAQALPAGSARGLVARFNPAFHFVELVRAPVMGLQVETASYIVVAVMTVGGWLVAGLLYRRFARFIPLWA
jgi:ABC-type polysaccharide/polyol phosphate export permease